MKRVLALDIGGTKTAFGVFASGGLASPGTVPTLGFDETISSVASRLGEEAFDAIGVACTGPLDQAQGRLLNDGTLSGWHGRSICRELGERFAGPVSLLNDADAALLGELFGTGNPVVDGQPAVMLTFGTGVGGAIWDGQALYAGAYGEHPEIGHLIVRPGGPACYCGAHGCLESLASGTAIGELCTSRGLGDVRDLSGHCRKGNPQALELVEEIRAVIGDALWTLTHVVRPDAFILGGGVMDDLFEWLAPLVLEFKASTVPGPAPRVLRAQLGNMAGLYGAAYAAGADL